MKIVAGELDRVIQNVLLYTDKKAVRLVEVFFVGSTQGLSAFSCDDYIAVSDSLSGDLSGLREFSLKIEDVELLGEWIKKDKKVVHKYEIEIRRKMTGIIFECDDTAPEDESDSIFLSDIVPNYNAWDLVMELLSEESTTRSFYDFAVRPERLTKLARLKADKEAPIHLRGVDINGHLIVQFKKGETLSGAIMPVDQSYVKEEFLWNKNLIDQ